MTQVKFYALCIKGPSRVKAGTIYPVWDMFYMNGQLQYVILNDFNQHVAVPADYFEFYSEEKPKEMVIGTPAQNIGGSYMPKPEYNKISGKPKSVEPETEPEELRVGDKPVTEPEELRVGDKPETEPEELWVQDKPETEPVPAKKTKKTKKK